MVICTGVLDFIPSYDVAVAEFARVLRSDGVLLASFANIVSPYAVWARFIAHPLSATCRSLYERLIGRVGTRRFPLSLLALRTRHDVTVVLRQAGIRPTEVAYYNFNPFISPLDRLLWRTAPSYVVPVITRLERLHTTPLRFLGAGFLIRGTKVT